MMRGWRRGVLTLFAMAAIAVLAGCGGQSQASASASGKIRAVGAENEYGNMISQIGGSYVQVTSIMSNPTTDPHTYEASPTDSQAVAKALLVVQNGLGYDSFMGHLESASPNSKRVVITVATALGLPPNTENPHLWYKPGVMATVAQKVAAALTKLDPSHGSTFAANLKAFDQNLKPWASAVAKLKASYPGAPVEVTEPVADYLLQASGLTVATPWAFQAAVMNGTDPSPEVSAEVQGLLTNRRVKVLVYNQQAVDATTKTLLSLANANGIPVVGVYETMPPGDTYQKWMTQETTAVYNALKNHKSQVTIHG